MSLQVKYWNAQVEGKEGTTIGRLAESENFRRAEKPAGFGALLSQ